MRVDMYDSHHASNRLFRPAAESVDQAYLAALRADLPFLSHKNHLVATKSKCCRRGSSRKCRLLASAMPAVIDGKILYGCVLLY
jgi:hypothetical protein